MLIDKISALDTKPLGTTNEKVPAIGIGTRGIQDYRLAEEALTHAFNLGLRLVEVSEKYGDGLAEELVGKVVKKFKRDEVFIVLRLEAIRFSDVESATKALLSSLRRMSLSYVDLVLVDGVNEIVGIPTQTRILEGLVDQGLARYIGLSNLRLKDVINVLQSLKKYNIAAIQHKYSVIDKRVEKDLLKFAIEKRMSFLACTPLEKGVVKQHPKLVYVSSKYSKTAIQVALNYLISKPYVVATPKSENKTHINEIYGALNWRLSNEDIKYLENSV